MEYRRFGVYTINCDPTIGAVINKTRPGLIISPNEMNRNLSTIMIVPITSSQRDNYPTRIFVDESSKKGNYKGYLVLDQIRTVDKTRIYKDIGDLDSK
ncbi:MAG: type II toxin-antitoxin system PemK/MazF family toxin, partial [Clostridiales bacterium]